MSGRPEPTVDEERRGIDEGLARDKVAFPDPAAAPLGTDAEAGGSPPTPTERRLDSASLEVSPKPRPRWLPVLFYCGVIVIFVLALLAVAALRR